MRVLSLVASLVGAASPDGQIALDERTPVEIVVRSPYATPESRAGGLAILEAFDRALRQHTALFGREAKDSPELMAAQGDAREVARVVARDARPPRYLLLVTQVKAGEEARLSALFVDVARAVDARDDATFQDVAVLARASAFTARRPEDGVTWAERLVTGELRPVLEREGAWDALGQIEVETAIDGAEIRLDGQLVGTSRSGTNRLSGARSGPRTVSIAAAGFAPWEVPVEVTAGAVARVVVELERAGGHHDRARSGVFWSGVGLALAGAALITYSAAEASGESRYLCLEEKAGEGCPGRPFVTFGGGDPSSEASLRGSSVAIAPLGLGLALGGMASVLGPELFETEGVPWISVLGGVTLGVLAYVISASAATDLHLSQ